MNKVALKIAVSPIVLGLTMVGCSTGPSMNSGLVTASTAVGADQASRHYDLANEAVRNGDLAGALAKAEKAVELSPRDAGYRMLLGDLYLKNGRFLSAETAFADVLTLNPGNNRAMFSLALAEIALGKQYAALVRLDRLAETAAPADLGLAYALAGQPQRAVAMLEPAARAPGADGRVRQNLALAYALSGDWQKARVTASQDLNPVDLKARMEQWASFAQPADQSSQVASLLGVTPAEDAGQPVRLALAPEAPEPVAYAAVEAAPVVPVIAEASVESAAAEIVPPMVEAPAETETEEVRYAAAAESLVTPQPAVIQAAAPVAPAPLATFAPAPRPQPAVARTPVSSRFVVQLGAYSNAAGVERAWASAQKRFGLGGDYAPLSATVSLPGKGTIHRLSVAGFTNYSEAAGVCRSIKAKGGACFVRGNSGDTPVRWASRDNRAG